MLQLTPTSTVEGSRNRFGLKTRQAHRLLLALVLLLVAIAVVVVADRQFWFGPDQLILDSDGTEPAVAPPSQSVPSAVQQSQPATAPVAKKHLPAAKPAAPKTATNSPLVATSRTVLPPLDVDVVGDSHRTVHPANKAAQIEITKPGSAANISAVTDAVGRERILSDAVQPQASYPLLAQNMNVQGSVVLQAIIGADGVIENLHVLSGPAILAAAAQQAVREWHFKPILQNGQPIETKANITVNFTIKVADNSKIS